MIFYFYSFSAVTAVLEKAANFFSFAKRSKLVIYCHQNSHKISKTGYANRERTPPENSWVSNQHASPVAITRGVLSFFAYFFRPSSFSKSGIISLVKYINPCGRVQPLTETGWSSKVIFTQIRRGVEVSDNRNSHKGFAVPSSCIS